MMFKRSLCWVLVVVFVGGAQFAANGFVAGTLVKVPDGYAAIETIVAGDLVCCCRKDGSIVARHVTAIVRCRPAQTCMVIQCVNGAELCVSSQQKFFVSDVGSRCKDAWIIAGALSREKLLFSAAAHRKYAIKNVLCVELPVEDEDNPTAFYGFTIDEEDNYLVTEHDIIAHN